METTVGKRITDIRTTKGISVDDLAQRSNISVEQITKIEEDKVLPSLAPLIKISRVLGVRLGTLLDDQRNIGPAITRKSEAAKGISFSNSNLNNSALNFFSLAGQKVGRNMEPFIIDIEPESKENNSLSSHEGEEFIFVLSGLVGIRYGNDEIVLEKGESIYYDSIVDHHVHSANNQPAQILAVVYAPN